MLCNSWTDIQVVQPIPIHPHVVRPTCGIESLDSKEHNLCQFNSIQFICNQFLQNWTQQLILNTDLVARTRMALDLQREIITGFPFRALLAVDGIVIHASGHLQRRPVEMKTWSKFSAELSVFCFKKMGSLTISPLVSSLIQVTYDFHFNGPLFRHGATIRPQCYKWN